MRIERVRPKVSVRYYCAEHALRSPEYDFGTLTRRKSSAKNFGWGVD